MPAVGEDLEPLVEGGLLLLEQDVPALQEAEAALLRGGVVAAGSGQDGPVQLVGDPLILQLPNVGAEGGALLLLVVDIAVVPGDPLFGGVDGDACVVLLLGGGQRDWVGLGRFWRRQGGSDLGVVDNTFSQALVVQGAGEVGGLAVAQVTWLWDRRRHSNAVNGNLNFSPSKEFIDTFIDTGCKVVINIEFKLLLFA